MNEPRIAIPKGFEKHALRLRPMAMPAHLEEVAKQLFEDVCCGSRSLWPFEPERMKEPDFRDNFYRLAHDGMWAAQERFIARIERGDAMAPGEQALYRMAMDTIAWQMLERQLCYVRRFYREQRQPSLSNSNFKSVVTAARHLRNDKPDSMPLIADLTTFLQIGDIFLADPHSGPAIIEVKEGQKNQEIGELARFYRQSGCERFKQIVSETESKHTVKQFERMLRQMDRMDFAAKVLGGGKAKDPDSDQEILIPEPYVPIEDWDAELNELFEEAAEKGWAINVIDDCLFVGAYAKHMLPASPIAFLGWLDAFCGGEFIPVARLTDSVGQPLALPLFAIPTSPERMMNLLFGRLHVCTGISIPGLVEACQKNGFVVRPPKNKRERQWVHKMRGEAIKYKGQAIVLEKNGKSVIPAAGIFVRSLFHFQRPMSFINAMFDNS
jgi:hypothetical protein